MDQFESLVIVVGAGPSGLATSACLNLAGIHNVVLEKEDCLASLWKKRSYDRVRLHLAKEFCELPHASFPRGTPTFVSKNDFISYLESYAMRFNVDVRHNRCVEIGQYDEDRRRWKVTARNLATAKFEVYTAQFLVVATGENSEGYVPAVPGLARFKGHYIHSSSYKNGKEYIDKDVLVVGCGNSGMEIASDLHDWGARSVTIANPGAVHVLTKEIVWMGMWMLKYLPMSVVDMACVALARAKLGRTQKYGIPRPREGPFALKASTARSPTINMGCIKHIKAGKIKVVPSALKSVEGSEVQFMNEEIKCVDAMIFATGYRSTVGQWLQVGDGDLFNKNGMPKRRVPNHWKGKNRLYSVGFAQEGLAGISRDAQRVAGNISMELQTRKESK